MFGCGDWRSAGDVSDKSDSGGFPHVSLSILFFIDLVLVFSSLAYPNLLGTQKGFVLVA